MALVLNVLFYFDTTHWITFLIRQNTYKNVLIHITLHTLNTYTYTLKCSVIVNKNKSIATICKKWGFRGLHSLCMYVWAYECIVSFCSGNSMCLCIFCLFLLINYVVDTKTFSIHGSWFGWSHGPSPLTSFLYHLFKASQMREKILYMNIFDIEEQIFQT